MRLPESDWRRLKRSIPKAVAVRYGLAKHITNRPRGAPRYDWIRVWMETHREKFKPIDFQAERVIPKPKSRKRIYRSSDSFLESFEWRQLRMVVIKKRGRRCECCGATPEDGVTVINVDHVKPRRDFPELALEESNLQILCGPCNHGKGNWDRTDWRSERAAMSVDMSESEAARVAEKFKM